MTIAERLPQMQTVRGFSFNADLEGPGPFYFDGCDTLVKLFRQRCQELKSKVAHREKDYGIWLSYTWTDFYEHARLIGLGLVSLGLKRGEVVSILSEDNKEWIYTDLGVQSVGGISSGVYTTDSAKQLSYLVNDSDSRFLFVENDEQLDKYLSVKDQMPGLVQVIVYDREGLHDFSDEKVIFLDDLYRIGREFLKANPNRFDEEIAKSDPKDTAILVYTSGTTGPPKGAMISHENIIVSVIGSVLTLPVEDTDEQLCFLPLCHILERLISVFTPIGLRSTVNFAESTETVFDNLREVSPHVFTAVPRVWEKVYSRITIMANEATGIGKWSYKQALAVGRATCRCAGERRSGAGRDAACLRLLGLHGAEEPAPHARFRASAPRNHGSGADLPGPAALVQVRRYHRTRGIRHDREFGCHLRQPDGELQDRQRRSGSAGRTGAHSARR
jgi:long-chain acyl-CoA synthetase